MFKFPQIKDNEEIKFIGEYDRSKSVITEIPGYPGGNALHPTFIARVCGNTIISNTYFSNDITDNLAISDETYSLTSYPENVELVKLGSVIWSGTYREKLLPGGFTPPSIQEFAVIGSSGIYSDVTRVIMDFNNIKRILYFIGPKNA